MTDEVLAVMRHAASAAIMPRFRNLKAADIEEKAPGEVVTQADREAELIIGQVLQKLRPDAVFVGEEATATDPGLLDAVSQQKTVWLVDPLDGTSNFVAGHDDFAVMVALVEKGQTIAAWIWHPVTSESWVARRGEGVLHNGKPVERPSMQSPDRHLRGSIHSRFFDDAHKQHVAESGPKLAQMIPGRNCSGVEYPEVVLGNHDFSIFRRTLPWDHAPGALILQEAGGVARRWDGRDYQPGDSAEGLIVAADPATWQRVADALLLEKPAR